MPEQKDKGNIWLRDVWRPAVGVTYIFINITDFVIFPILWALIHTLTGDAIPLAWKPLTLESAGMFHISFGAILGVSAWSRGQEKIAGVTKE